MNINSFDSGSHQSGATPVAATLSEAWRMLADECYVTATLNDGSVVLGRYSCFGLCSIARSLYLDGFITKPMLYDILDVLQTSESKTRTLFLFPLTEEGRRQRKQLCLSQARKYA